MALSTRAENVLWTTHSDAGQKAYKAGHYAEAEPLPARAKAIREKNRK